MAGFMRQPQMIQDPNAAPAPLRADDVDLQAQEGDFIMGYPAMQQSGPRVRSLVEQAMLKAKDKGVKTKGYKTGDKVDILVHNGEMHIPKELVSNIEGGYATLKKLNAPSKYQSKGEVDSGEFEKERMEGSWFESEEQKKAKEFKKETRQNEKEKVYTDLEEYLTDPKGFSARYGKYAYKKTVSDAQKYNIDIKEQMDDIFNLGKDRTTLGAFSIPQKHLVHPPQIGGKNFSDRDEERGNEIFGTTGDFVWNGVTGVTKKLINKHYGTIGKTNKRKLTIDVLNYIKESVENGQDIESEILLNPKFIKNSIDSTMLHNTLNTLTLLHSGKPLKYKAVFTGRSIRFEYPDGTPALVGGIKTTNTAEWPIRGEFDNKLTYQSVNGKSYNDTTRLSKEALKAKMENGTLGNNYTNSAGGKGTLMNLDETVDFPLQYRYLANFLKKAENEKYQNDMLHKVAGKWHIGYGHQLTEAEAKSPEWQQYKNKSFSDVIN